MVEAQLGRGGFKTVYRARNPQAAQNGFPERVALCVPHAQDAESRTLLENECRIAQSLEHPGIVKFFAVEEASGVFFAVTELVEGETLSQVLKRRGPLPLAEAVEVARQVAEALDYLHAGLRFHRDIKPANLMLTPPSGEEKCFQVKLLDFGLARLMAHSQYLATTRVGSTGYMAPEQFSGAAGMNADVWALGVTLFQMITNTLPFMAKDEATLVSYPPPEMERLREMVDAVATGADGSASHPDAALRETLARAVVGLTEREAERVLRRAALARGALDRSCVAEVIRQKQQIVRKAGVLEFVQPDVSFDDVGGLANLKAWFRKRREAFSPEGMRFGLRSPRGAVLVGVPGCGKSLSAKALAADWEVPLLRLDMGRLRGSLVGESERRLRLALQTAEVASPCVLWIDELEKAFAGLANALDSGVSQRLFGMFLTWLSEKRTPVFVVATANNVRQLPPEFTRRGRFDEVFFVGLPTAEERRAIWNIHLKRPKRLADVKIERLVAASEGFTGAEIAEAVVSAMFQAFSEQQRAVTEQDLVAALREGVPMSQSHAAVIAEMLAWGQMFAAPAT